MIADERLAKLEQLGDVHRWLIETNGPMTKAQVAGRANHCLASLIEYVVAGVDEQVKAEAGRLVVWMVHLAGYLNIDLLDATIEQVEADKAFMRARLAAIDAAVKAS